MKEKFIRIRVPDSLYIKYKVYCTKNNISLPKQTAQIIQNFLDIKDSEEKLWNRI